MPNILMPALSPTMEEGKLSKWLVKVGDTVKPGDVLAEIETDKATMEVESVDSGKVTSILVPEGTEGVKVNTPIALVLDEGEAAPTAEAVKDPSPGADAPTSPPGGEVEQSAAAVTPLPGGRGPSEARGEGALPAAPATPAPHFIPAADPDLPAGVEMVEMTVRQALNEAMAEEMRRDEDVFVMGEEVAEYQGAYKITQGLLQEFGPQRVVDTPITEHGFAGIGVGAAFAGLRPIVEFMTWNFAMQAIDQIINSAAKQLYMSGGQVHAPIVFRGPNGVASRVGAQHSQDYSAWYSHVPGLYVVAPFSAADAKGLLKSAIRSNNPIVFLENEILYGSTGLVPKVDDFLLPIGKARLARAGKDVTIVSFSMGMRYATQATEKLVAAGVDVELIDLRTLRPMDSATVIESVKKTGRLVTVEEGWPQGGIGAELCARVVAEAFDYLDAPPTRVTGKDVPMPYAANLEKLALPNVDEVVAAVNAVTYRGG
ncbi:MAG: pyruvate dehydrogenase complex E1 component subunit beta [Devosia nanyangense]|uniref:Pyruvate dehydrogenase E1 component subunit beta n=1 Tax=Devosia nanyangense TaxID=1228055 RepID=A0A933NWG5_9HYPH|nr:pyruvate dehydrogenase complex E1 component subunit beta [Devosia nanyangense]